MHTHSSGWASAFGESPPPATMPAPAPSQRATKAPKPPKPRKVEKRRKSRKG